MILRPHEDLLDPPVPQDQADTERALLAAVLVDPSRLAEVGQVVSGDDFHDPDYGRLFATITTLHEAGWPIGDPAALVPELKRMKLPEAVSTAAFMFKLLPLGIGAHAVYYAKQVTRAATLRRQHGIGCDLLQRLHDPAADPHDVAQWLDARLQGIGGRSADPSRTIGEIAADVLADLRQPRDHARGIMSGLVSHDMTVGGWMPGELVILAARPGIGKTALGLQTAMHNATRGRPVLFVSLEMRDRELVTRTLCGLSGVNSRRLRTGRMESGDLEAIEREADEVGEVPLRIWAPSSATLARIRAVAKRDAAAGGLALLVVDYIGLVRPADSKRPRHEQVAEVSAGLKSLAKELNVPVLALCQLNREADAAEPRLSHLRESGSIEQDADIVLFIHRDKQDATEARLIIAKHRHGDTGAVALRWVPERTRFDDTGDAVEAPARSRVASGPRQKPLYDFGEYSDQ